MRKIQLNNENISGLFQKGLESTIYLYDDSKYYNNTVLFKCLKSIDERKKEKTEYYKKYGLSHYLRSQNFNISTDFLDNKHDKILLIDNLKCLNDEIKIFDMVYNNNNFKGYTMEKVDGNLIDCFEKKKNIIKYLKLIKEKIILLNSNNVYIGDFNNKNFLVSNNFENIKLCDLDNFKIDNLDFDTKTKYMTYFEKYCKNLEYIDSYCFNIFTILMLCRYNSVDPYTLDKFKLNYMLNSKENKKIIESMNYLDDTYEPKYLIDNLR